MDSTRTSMDLMALAHTGTIMGTGTTIIMDTRMIITIATTTEVHAHTITLTIMGISINTTTAISTITTITITSTTTNVTTDMDRISSKSTNTIIKRRWRKLATSTLDARTQTTIIMLRNTTTAT